MGRPQRRSAESKSWQQDGTTYGRLGELLLAARARARGRFSHGSAWFRLVLLGLLLTIIGTVALTSILNIRPLPMMPIGEVAVISGMAAGLLTVKIAHAPIPWDWLSNGLLMIGAGHVLAFDPSLGRLSTLGLFAIFALGSAAARVWIGLTAHPRKASTWILASGCASALATALIAITAIIHTPVNPPLIIALDIIFQGIAIMAFGFDAKLDR